jgi:hypothetical protein
MKSLSLVAGLAHAATAAIVPPAALKPSIYHDWAHKHWVEEYFSLLSSISFPPLNLVVGLES